jgi:hypothetical protein
MASIITNAATFFIRQSIDPFAVYKMVRILHWEFAHWIVTRRDVMATQRLHVIIIAFDDIFPSSDSGRSTTYAGSALCSRNKINILLLSQDGRLTDTVSRSD